MRGVEEILQHRLFMFIPEEQAGYYMNLEQFGDSVAMFPDAIPDMLETSTCYASGRATACVFHAMRVTEYGLRFLGNELGVECGSATKPLPIEFATWEAVLLKIEEKRREVRTQVKGQEHEKKTIAYADLANQCSHLKDLCKMRNPTMHSRGLYAMPEALGAMTRVAAFMKVVAGNEHAPTLDLSSVAAIQGLVSFTKELASGS